MNLTAAIGASNPHTLLFMYNLILVNGDEGLASRMSP